jgi:hypothetical protein
MALFTGNKEQDAATKAAQEAPDFLGDEAGQGLNDIGENQTQVPLLKLIQSNSQEALDNIAKPGDWFNTVTKESYGPVVSVIPIQFKVAWFEWLPDQKGLAGRYEVGSIVVEGDPYTGMINPKTGNKVNETWLYALLLADRVEDGLVLYSSTRTSIKFLKKWNTQLKMLRLPNGQPAPIFGGVWDLIAGRDKNDKGQFWSLIGGIKFNRWITRQQKELFVAPARALATSQQIEYKPEPAEENTESVGTGNY